MNIQIITNCFEDDLEWLRSSPYPVRVFSKNKETKNNLDFAESIDFVPNIACEVTSYLYYIINYYDQLPERSVFIHGHENANHQKMPICEAIEKFSSEDFVDINRFVNCYMILLKESVYYNLWNYFFEEKPPVFLNFKYGSQFIVSSNKIKTRPKKFYEDIYRKIIFSPYFCMNKGYRFVLKNPSNKNPYVNNEQIMSAFDYLLNQEKLYYSKIYAQFFESVWHWIFNSDSGPPSVKNEYVERFVSSPNENIETHESYQNKEDFDNAVKKLAQTNLLQIK